MAKSYNIYEGNGFTTDFGVPFPYLSRAHVKVRINGAEAIYSWKTPFMVSVLPAPEKGAYVVVQRSTPSDPLVDFSDGATLVETDLDTATLQSLYIAQESADYLGDALTLNATRSAYAGAGVEIRNITDGQSTDSAATVGQIEKMVIDSGNVVKPSETQIGATLKALPDGSWRWLGGSSDKVNLVVICGQSNAQGARNGGPNPASSMVKAWDAKVNAWGSSDYTKAPWTYANPDGNTGNNNIGLSFAHRLATETGKPTYLVYYYVGGTSIDHWVYDGNTGGNGDFYTGWKARMEAALASPELAGKTTIDALIWAQGEEDYTRDFGTYLAKFAMLDKQFRAESWFNRDTPIFVTGMSTLHDRYAPEKAQQFYCAQVNANCRYVNSKGLVTQYDIDGTGDFTHWLGPSLWEFGFERVWAAYNGKQVAPKAAAPLFWGRGSGTASPADPQVIASFTSLTSWDSRNKTSAAVNSLVAATGSISWGEQCAADGNYSYAFGWANSTANLSNYTLLAGRELTSSDAGSWGAAFGFQNQLNAAYSIVAGRGNIAATNGSAITGTFAEYTTAQTDPVTFQHGVGDTSSNRKNALTGRKSGAVKRAASYASASLPSAANAGPGFELYDTDLQQYVKSDGIVWAGSGAFTWLSEVSPTGQNAIDWGSIPATASEIILVCKSISLTGTDTFNLLLGTAAGLETAAYWQSANTSAAAWIVGGGVAATLYNFIVKVVRGPNNDWLYSCTGSSVNGAVAAGGWKSLAGPLARIQFRSSTTNTFDNGSVVLGYK